MAGVAVVPGLSAKTLEDITIFGTSAGSPGMRNRVCSKIGGIIAASQHKHLGDRRANFGRSEMALPSQRLKHK
jgi:hypothetical protein